ncbi:universal stress protein [Conexibacter woesei]|uniref:universal stress protein n=1 Tax=Conexibacter woesei TaxID=191495 RepID=UPI0004080FA1|nr:universal stress protein [Conexibacter woesei]
MFRNVLLGLDFTPASQRALDEAIELCERHGGRLTILTAIPEVRGWAAGPCESVTAANQLNEQLERDACELQHDALERVPADLPVRTLIRREHGCAALLAELETGRHDTLVIGASTTGRVRCTRSLTRRMLRRGDIPVLVVSDPPRLHLPRDGGALRGGGLGRGWRRAREERAATS